MSRTSSAVRGRAVVSCLTSGSAHANSITRPSVKPATPVCAPAAERRIRADPASSIRGERTAVLSVVRRRLETNRPNNRASAAFTLWWLRSGTRVERTRGALASCRILWRARTSCSYALHVVGLRSPTSDMIAKRDCCTKLTSDKPSLANECPPAATKLLHAIFRQRNSLTSQPKLRSSLQSIMGATLTRRSIEMPSFSPPASRSNMFSGPRISARFLRIPWNSSLAAATSSEPT